MELEALLDTLRAAARKAAEAALEVEAEGRRLEVVGRGESGDTTLAADKAAEDAAIREILSRLGSARIVSEEAGEKDFGEKPRYTFVIDPVDGSRNYKRGIPLYAVSIAAAEGSTLGSVVAGVVYAPRLGAEFYAVKGRGAYLNGEPISASGAERLPGSLVGLSTTPKAQFLPYLVAEELSRRGAVLRSWGSVSVEVAFLSAGGLDAYLEAWGTMRVVDVAAALLIAREAGAEVRMAGKLSRDPSLKLDERLSMVVAATPSLASELEDAYRAALGWEPLRVFEVMGAAPLR